MKRNILLFFVGLMIIIGLRTTFAHDRYVPPPKVDMVNVLQKLQTAGYCWVKKIKFDDGVYKLKGMNDRGEKVRATLNSDVVELPANLPFSKIQPKTLPTISMLQAVQKVIAGGYNDVRQVDVEKNVYEIEAFDSKGKEVDLEVNKTTGVIEKEWF